MDSGNKIHGGVMLDGGRLPAEDPGLQAKLAEQLMDLFDVVARGRLEYYATHPNEVPDRSSVPLIIRSYSSTNAAISGAISLVPGPWGMLAALPEVVAVIRNQLAMICDIGVAYGKTKVLTKELLAGVMLTALGASAGALLAMHGGKLLVRRVALRAFQRVVMLLAGRVSQQLIKSMVSKWFPIVGAAAMAAWSHYLTKSVGRKAAELLDRDIHIDSEVEWDDSEIPTQKQSVQQAMLDVLRIRALVNLMMTDRKVTVEERAFVEAAINGAAVSPEDKATLACLVESGERSAVDFSAFAANPDEAVGLLTDLVALAKRDGEFHLAEKMYIKQVGKLIGFSEPDIEEMIADVQGVPASA